MYQNFKKLPLAFYRRADVAQISKDLLGKVLVTCVDGQLTSGIIVETEAYAGTNDKACHASGGRRTTRTAIMYHVGGVGYVYLCYGLHHLFNIVTNVRDRADAVLIRAIEPLDGVAVMLARRNMAKVSPMLTAGPGSLCKAMGITLAQNGVDLSGNTIWVEDRGIQIREDAIEIRTRVGVAYAGEDALKPWRFSIKANPWVSRGK